MGYLLSDLSGDGSVEASGWLCLVSAWCAGVLVLWYLLKDLLLLSSVLPGASPGPWIERRMERHSYGAVFLLFYLLSRGELYIFMAQIGYSLVVI